MIQTRREVVIRTPAEWDMFRKEHQPAGEPPVAVDFSKEMVVGIFLGSKPTAGYSVTIVSATEQDGVLHVKYRETGPSPGTMAAQVITYPYALVAIPKSATKDVKFEKIG